MIGDSEDLRSRIMGITALLPPDPRDRMFMLKMVVTMALHGHGVVIRERLLANICRDVLTGFAELDEMEEDA